MKQIAIIAPTASGKTALSIKLAHKTNSVILSLDSLAIYKQINIASAKPTLNERDGIVHFGIDVISPNEVFDVMKFINIYEEAKSYALNNNKNLIIVGGTSFYLKAMIEGISKTPIISEQIQIQINDKMANNTINEIYDFLYDIDKEYMKSIKSNDSYRIQKALSIYLSCNEKPSVYFCNNKAKPIIQDIKLFEIIWDVEELRSRIKKRTQNMIEHGLINEVIYLEHNYKRNLQCMKSIGIKQALEYLDGKLNILELEEKISIATAGLAKRQRTFNKGQFNNVIKLPLDKMYDKILDYFRN